MYIIGSVISIPQEKLVENLIILPVMLMIVVFTVAMASLFLVFMAAGAIGVLMYLADE